MINKEFYGDKLLAKIDAIMKGEEVEAEFDDTIGALFINTGVQIATADDYQEVIGG